MLDENASIEEMSAELLELLDQNAPPATSEVDMRAAEHLVADPRPARRLAVTPDEYFALPGLSSSVAKTLIARSPAHALAQHRREASKAPTKEMDLGSVVHALVLGVGKRIQIIDAANYKTKAAQVERDQARAAGFVPILRHQYAAAEVIAREAKRELADRGIPLVGESEVGIEWWEPTERGYVRCRGMLDHLVLRERDALVVDLKIVGNAETGRVERSAEDFGYAIQEAAYRRAVTALTGRDFAGRVDFLFAFCEAPPPYAVNLVRGDGMFRELGERRWLRAVATWATCVASNAWPAFGLGVNPLSVPPWALRNEGLEP
jgi:hypothetical protein